MVGSHGKGKVKRDSMKMLMLLLALAVTKIFDHSMWLAVLWYK